MSKAETTLHLLCGKIGAGKSTLAATLARQPNTVAISEDHWIARLYPGEIASIADYVVHAKRLRATLTPHLVDLLRLGISVVLDFQANTRDSRAWMRGLIDQTGVAHQLHVLEVPDDICKARLRARNAAGSHDFAATDAEFDLITSHFVAPTPEEGFNLVVHRWGQTAR
jgi:predicted kinase